MLNSTNILTDEKDLKEVTLQMRTVAVVGMQNERKADRPAYQIPKVAHDHGIDVIPINPQIESSLGLKAFPNLKAFGKAVDVVNVFRKSELIEPLVDEILALPKNQWPKVVWLQSGIQNDVAAQKLANAGIKVIQDACLGVYVSRYRR